MTGEAAFALTCTHKALLASQSSFFLTLQMKKAQPIKIELLVIY
jgi:hypothetical protein